MSPNVHTKRPTPVEAMDVDNNKMPEPQADEAFTGGNIYEEGNMRHYNEYVVDMTQPPVGNGRHGDVYMGMHSKTGKKVAVKTVVRKQRTEDRQRMEILLMRRLKHPNIVRLVDVIETDREFILITEFVEGGELFSRIRDSGPGYLEEKEMRHYFAQLISAVEYCHKHGISHRDLKPENILLDAEADRVKIIDFGFGNIMQPNKQLKTRCGSPHYMPPEIVQGKQYQGHAVDVWCLGVTLYVSLCGRYPFDGGNIQELYAEILTAPLHFPKERHLSLQCQQLVYMMLERNPATRITIEAIKEHPWLVAEEKQAVRLTPSSTRMDRKSEPTTNGKANGKSKRPVGKDKLDDDKKCVIC
eukprot:Clim_evm25s227 gene=Clim_evmTU25s227